MEIQYPGAFQQALVKVLDTRKTFNYVYLGGAFTELDQDRSLWLFVNGRRVRVCSPANSSGISSNFLVADAE